mmetsp:Transcript_12424/g.31300  ORF Transcript_12424/g.31300 Transcript_12424/m.31300 type:complete len:572 (-) Transcript_12424:267-1982(-)
MDGYLPILEYGEAPEQDAAEHAPAVGVGEPVLQKPPPAAAAPPAVKNRRPVAPRSAKDRGSALTATGSAGGKPAGEGVQGAGKARPPEKREKVAAKARGLQPDRKAALDAVLLLLEGEILSREEVAAAAASLSRADCEALAEERAIAGKCGNPCCGRPHAHVPARERQRISRQHRKVYTQVQAASNYCSPECEAELLALALHGLALRAGTQVQAPQEGVSPPQIQAAGQRAGGARVQKDEIMAPGIVEKAAEEVSRDSAAGFVDCLSKEAQASSPAQRIAQAGAVEGFVPKAARERLEADQQEGAACSAPAGAAPELARQCSHGRRVSFAGEEDGAAHAAEERAAAKQPPPQQLQSGAAAEAGAASAGQGAAPRKFKPNLSAASKRGGQPKAAEGEEGDIDFDFANGWLSDIDAVPELSSFGQMHTTIYNWVTAATQRHLAGKQLDDDSDAPRPESWPRVKEGMRQQLGRHLLPVLQALGNPRVPRRAVEGALGELVDTLHCGGPLPPFKVAEWRLLLLILLRAMSHCRLPHLQDTFGAEEHLPTLHKLLTAVGSGMYEFDILHDIVYPFQ